MIMRMLVQAAMTFAHPIANIADHDLDGAWPRLTHFSAQIQPKASTYPTMSSMTAIECKEGQSFELTESYTSLCTCSAYIPHQTVRCSLI